MDVETNNSCMHRRYVSIHFYHIAMATDRHELYQLKHPSNDSKVKLILSFHWSGTFGTKTCKWNVSC